MCPGKSTTETERGKRAQETVEFFSIETQINNPRPTMKKSGGGSWVKDVSGMMNIHSIGPH